MFIREPIAGFSVTWDGRTVAWSQIDRRESDLMMVENFQVGFDGAYARLKGPFRAPTSI